MKKYISTGGKILLIDPEKITVIGKNHSEIDIHSVDGGTILMGFSTSDECDAFYKELEADISPAIKDAVEEKEVD